MTVDEVYWDGGMLVIQESKKSSRNKLPGLGDIQDGLFRCILYHNINELYLDNNPIRFSTHLKLTGTAAGILNLPAADSTKVQAFAEMNQLPRANHQLLKRLNSEAQVNQGLRIQIAGCS